MSKLQIGPRFELPRDTVTQTIVVYGGKGMGKTNLGGVLVEELADNGQRFSVLDPVGVWWGLQHGADGKSSSGIPVLLLGGARGDLPIEPTGGAVVADLVADEAVSTVVDISRHSSGRMWTVGEQTRFVAEYCLRLFERQGERRRPLMQVLDEAGRFVPQQIPSGAVDVAKCVGAIERLVELGRNVGVGVTLITQRSARMNKSVSELAECMVAFRTVGPRSIDAILDWFGEHVEKARWKELLEQLRSLPRGRALVVSPGWLQFEGTVEVRIRRTFDSSSTPDGAQARRGPGAAAKPDIEKYRTRMAETIERAKADDPKELQRKLRALEAELKKAQTAKPAAAAAPPPGPLFKIKEREVPMLKGPALAKLWKAIERAEKLAQQLLELNFGFGVAAADLAKQLRGTIEAYDRYADENIRLYGDPKAPKPRGVLYATDTREKGAATAIDPRPGVPERRPAAVAAPVSPRAAAAAGGDGSLPRMERAFLTALAQRPQGLQKAQVLLHANYKSSGDTSTAFGALTRDGLIHSDRGLVTITPLGLERLGSYTPLPRGKELRDQVLGEMSRMEAAFLRVLFDDYPEPVGKGAILERAGYKSSGDTSTAFGKLVRINYARPERGALRAAPEFFED